MPSANTSSWITESFFKLFTTLPIERRRELISKLSQSITSDQQIKNEFWQSYGDWAGPETAEELIASIRSSRYFSRDIEPM
jgi:hypothetical protein